jgi:hypothetical protein
MAEDGRGRGELEVDRPVSPGVRRITSLEDVAWSLWPAAALR